MGPFLAPIIGGALAQGLGWRSTQWFLVIYGGVLIIFLIFALPETLKARKNMVDEAAKEHNATLETEIAATGDAGGQIDIEKEATTTEIVRTKTLQRTSTHKSVAKKSRKYIKILKRCSLDPLKIVLLLRFPAVFLTVIWASITFGCLYFLNISIETTFSEAPYNFSTLIVGLLYIPNSLGYLIASLFGGRWLDHIMKREAMKAGRIDEKGRLVFRPEDRMKENAWIAGAVFPVALIWYGWSAEKGVFWLVPVSLLSSHLFSFPLSSPPFPTERHPRLSSPSPDVSQFLLWPRLHDNVRHGHNHAHRIHAQTRLKRHRRQQFHAKHFLLRWWYNRCTPHKGDRKWMALHDLGNNRSCSRSGGDLGNEEIRGEMEGRDGSRDGGVIVRLFSCCKI